MPPACVITPPSPWYFVEHIDDKALLHSVSYGEGPNMEKKKIQVGGASKDSNLLVLTCSIVMHMLDLNALRRRQLTSTGMTAMPRAYFSSTFVRLTLWGSNHGAGMRSSLCFT
jgi:hypothetical protein